MPAASTFTFSLASPTAAGTLVLLAVMLALVTLIEALVLHWRVREVGFRRTLLRSMALNLVSQILCWLMAVVSCGESELLVAPALLIGVLLLIIPATEIPLLHHFYRKNQLSWCRASGLVLAANAISLALLLLGLFCLKVAIGWAAGILADRDRAAWDHPEMLAKTTGWILVPVPASEPDNTAAGLTQSPFALRSFEVNTHQWSALPRCLLSDPNRWDARGNLAALPASRTGPDGSDLIRIVNLPGCQEQILLDPSGWVKPDQGATLGICDVAIAPNLSQVAVLVRIGEVLVRRDDTSHLQLGRKCRLVVVDLPGGTVHGASSRLAIDGGVTWLPNSKRAIFTSLRDESIFSTDPMALNESKGIGLEPAKAPLAKDLVAFDPCSGGVQTYFSGEYPLFIPARVAMLVRGYKKLGLVGMLDRVSVNIPIHPLVPGTVSVSPDGDFLMVPVPNRNPLELPAAMLTVVSLKEPEKRHLIGEGTIFRSVWIDEPRKDAGCE
jgi:hypothetical protein